MRIESEIGVSESDTFSDFFLVQVVKLALLASIHYFALL
jgi:hypothetical protein